MFILKLEVTYKLFFMYNRPTTYYALGEKFTNFNEFNHGYEVRNNYAKNDLRSLDFAVNRFLMKIFRSHNSEVIAECRRYFQFNLPSELIEKKKLKFERNYNRCTILRDMCVRQWNII